MPRRVRQPPPPLRYPPNPAVHLQAFSAQATAAKFAAHLGEACRCGLGFLKWLILYVVNLTTYADPSAPMTVNKTAELVQLFGPALCHSDKRPRHHVDGAGAATPT